MSGATAEQRLPMQRGFVPGSRGARAVDWLTQNLFGSLFNTLLSLVVLALALLILPPLIRWAVIHASISGQHRAACSGDGACWTFIRVRLPMFFYGLYPSSQYWRVDLAFVLLAAFCIPRPARRQVRHRLWFVLLLFTVFPALATWLLSGGCPGTGLRRHQPLGRADARRHHRLRHGGWIVPAGHPACVRPTLAVACHPHSLGRLHRALARRPAAHRAVHVGRAAAAVPARRACRSTGCCAPSSR